ncbi:MAG: hypothetical protein IKI19_06780 [Prevotella sp.]|nr:hypothetical protein [Prevotella sp.]
MKNLKFMSLLMALVSVITIGFTSCGSDDDDTPAPTIEMEEANIEGNELCVEADIVAQGRTASILINICDPSGKTIKVAQPVAGSKYIGVLNIDDFHVHVDITGKNVVVGDLLKLTVADANGRSTTAQKSITEEDEDNEHHHD